MGDFEFMALWPLLKNVAILLMIVLFIFFFVCLIIYICQFITYRSSDYYTETKNKYGDVTDDTGAFGEYMTAKQLENFMFKGARLLYNTYLVTEKGSTEIDCIMVHTSGIYVIESKNYSGWIFGNEKDKYWTQSLLSGKGRKSKKIKFYNPILQNAGHIKNIRKVVNSDSIPIHSLIVFSQRCELKKVTFSDSNAFVIKRKYLKRTVKMIDKKYANALTREQVEQISKKLSEKSIKTETIKEEHIERVQSIQNSTHKKQTQRVQENIKEEHDNVQSMQENIKEEHENVQSMQENIQTEPENNLTQQNYQNMICPRCGANLIERVAKRGANTGNKFLGCSNYPSCRYIKNLQ
jgi:predicted RNA-binding Zn-ribbon protein involved in translation (DUF1610 family)